MICCAFAVGLEFRDEVRVGAPDDVALLLDRFGCDRDVPAGVDASMLRSPSRSTLRGLASRRFEMPPRLLALLVLAWPFLVERAFEAEPFLGPMGAIVMLDCVVSMKQRTTRPNGRAGFVGIELQQAEEVPAETREVRRPFDNVVSGSRSTKTAMRQVSICGSELVGDKEQPGETK